MEIVSILNHYLDPMLHAPQPELKPLKAPACEQDVQRFDAICNGEGTYQPKAIDLIMPATEPNAIENVRHTFVNRVSTLKKSMDNRLGRVDKVFERIKLSDKFDFADGLKIQWELSMFSLESTMVSKSGEKAGEGIKTLFRNQ